MQADPGIQFSTACPRNGLYDLLDSLCPNRTRSPISLPQAHQFVVGSYAIGLEHDTVESVKRDREHLCRLRPDLLRFTILTPFSQTAIWSQLERKYRIKTCDWSKFQKNHLVWNHRHLTCEDATMLLRYAYQLFGGHPTRLALKLAARLTEWKGSVGVHLLVQACL